MDINFAKTAEQIYTTLMGSNFQVEAYDNKGNLKLDPKQASRFVSTDPDIIVNLDRDQKRVTVDYDSMLSNHPVLKLLHKLAMDHNIDFDMEIIGKSHKPKTESMSSFARSLFTGGREPYYKISPNVRTGQPKKRKPRSGITPGVRVVMSVIDNVPVWQVLEITNDPTPGQSVFKNISTHDSKNEAIRAARIYALDHDKDLLEVIVKLDKLMLEYNEFVHGENQRIAKRIKDSADISRHKHGKIWHPEEYVDLVKFGVSTDRAQYAVTDMFGDLISRDEDGHFVAPRKIWSKIEQIAYDADGVGAEEIYDTESMMSMKNESSDPSGLFHAAKYLNKSFLVKADMAEGGTKTFRVKAQSERVALEKFQKHHAQAKVLSVKEEQGVAEGYILKKTNIEKTFTPGDPDEYYTSGGADVTTKYTDYEIINNKTGQVVGTASWTTNDYFGPGALKITMKNGATRWLDIWEREKGNPQTAFNRFVKDPKTAKKYKEQGVAEGKKDTKPGWMLRRMRDKNHPEFQTIADKQAAMAALKRPSKDAHQDGVPGEDATKELVNLIRSRGGNAKRVKGVLVPGKKQGVAEGSDRDRTVHISKDEWKEFSDWMESEGLGISEEDGIEHRDLGDVIELIYPPHDPRKNSATSYMYASEWDVRDRKMSESKVLGVAEAIWDRPSQSYVPRDGKTFGQTNHPREEHCDACGDATGHAGPGEDSNVDDEGNVYCDDCYAKQQGIAEGSDKNLNEMNPYLVQQGLEVVIDFLSKYPTATAVTAGAAGAIAGGAIIKKLVTKAWQNHKELEQLKQDILSWSYQKLHANKNVGRMGGKVAKIIQKEIERRKQNLPEQGVAEAAKWRSTAVAKKVTDPGSMDTHSYDYHNDNPLSSGLKRATSDTETPDYDKRRPAEITTRGPRQGMATRRHIERLKDKIRGKQAYGDKSKPKLPEEAEQIDEKLEREGPVRPDLDKMFARMPRGKVAQAYAAKKAAERDAMNKANDPGADRKGLALSVTDTVKAIKKGYKRGVDNPVKQSLVGKKGFKEEAEQIDGKFVIHKGKHEPGRASSLGGQTLHGVTVKDVYTDKKEAQAHADAINKGRGYKPEDHKNPLYGGVLYQVSPMKEEAKQMDESTTTMYAGEWDGRDRDRSESKVLEGFGHMLGSTKTSYQPLDGVKIIVRHKAPVSEEVRGSRSRNIKEIFIQRGDERFRMRENSLQAARAMARHVHSGGEVYDQIGKAINEMATEQKALANFVRFVSRSGMVNETNSEYVVLATKRVQAIRETFRKLMGPKTYANAVENINNEVAVELTETDLDLESKFTSISCDQRVTNAVASMRAALARQSAFETAIQEAIGKEDFGVIKHRLQEQDAIQFENATARLAHQVSQLSTVAQDARLGTYLNNISKKIAEGIDLEAFETKTVKLCLERAKCKRGKKMESRDPIKESKFYAEFIEKFDIF